MDNPTVIEGRSEGEQGKTARPDGAGRPSAAEPIVNRFALSERVGRGARGVVYRAHDPQLARDVAIKLLSFRDRKGLSDHDAQLLVREARAAAALSHPNIVAVHDVGTVSPDELPPGLLDDPEEGAGYVVMEFIEGESLRDWLARGPHPLAEVLDVFCQAGRGLAAAHERGLVHRDIKPANIMCGRDGRVRVADFGLARWTGSGTSVSAQSTPGGSNSGSEMSRTGLVAGTPAYMAPEQHAGHSGDPRVDQFGFAATLYEALYGVRPFAGRDLDTLAKAKRRFELTPPRFKRKVPRRVARAVERGLAPQSEDRFASVTELLEAIDLTRVTRQRRVLGLAGVVALAVTGVGVDHFVEQDRLQGCMSEAEVIDEVWSPDARVRIREVILASERSYAQTLAETLDAHIGGQARAWKQGARSLCGTSSASLQLSSADERKARWCLAERLEELRVLIDAISSSGDLDLAALLDVAASLSPVGVCVDDRALRSVPPPPSDIEREQVEELRASLLRARYLGVAGSYDTAGELARSVRAEAEQLSWTPLVHESREVEIRALLGAAQFEPAVTLAEVAYFEAGRVEHWGAATRAATLLVRLLGDKLRDEERADPWLRHAEMALSLDTDPFGLRAAELAQARGELFQARADLSQARVEFDRALELRASELGHTHPLTLVSARKLGTVLLLLDELDTARAQLEQVLARQEEIFGPTHPEVATTLTNLGIIFKKQAQLDAARVANERALGIKRAELGDDHPHVANSLLNLGNIHRLEGEYDLALARYAEALPIYIATFGTNHPRVGNAYLNLGNAYLELGDPSRAVEALEQARSIYVETLDPSHRQIGLLDVSLGVAHAKLGDDEAALASYLQARPVLAESSGPTHSETLLNEINIANAEGRLGRLDAAEQRLEEVQRVIEHQLAQPKHPELPRVLAGLGQIARLRAQPERARALFDRSLELARANDTMDEELLEIINGPKLE